MRYKVEELRNKLKEAEEIAKINKIPFFAAMPVENDDAETKYEYFHATPYYTGEKLTDDYISPMLLVINGFQIQKSKPINIEDMLAKAKAT